jgi:hypothetical protein
MLHGVYLVANHAWRNLRAVDDEDAEPTRAQRLVGRAAMFACAVIAIPYFRADSVTSGWRIMRGMFGLDGFHRHLYAGLAPFALVGLGLVVTQLLPNTQEVLRDRLEAVTAPLEKHKGDAPPVRTAWSWPNLSWRPTTLWAIAIGIAAWYELLKMAKTTDFLYFQF